MGFGKFLKKAINPINAIKGTHKAAMGVAKALPGGKQASRFGGAIAKAAAKFPGGAFSEANSRPPVAAAASQQRPTEPPPQAEAGMRSGGKLAVRG